MRSQGRFAALTLVMAFTLALFGGAVQAFAAPTVPSVGKTLQMNPGSTVTATFSYTATAKELTVGSTAEKTYTDGPEVAIADIVLTDATSAANNTGTGAITFGGAADASRFTHAGVYAWVIRETTGTYSGRGEMQYDNAVYTLIATVANGADGPEFSSFVIVRGEATSTDNADKVSGTSIPFTNRYTVKTSDQDTATDLRIGKAVAGSQGDKTREFEFTITFTAPAILPAGTTSEQALDAIVLDTAGGARIVEAPAATGGTRTVKFAAADAKSVTFKGVLVGTTYTISEAAVAGYTQSYASVANGVSGSSQNSVLVGEKTNTATMTNTHTEVTPTGLIMNNLPFILMGVVAIAGAVFYGIAKRRLER